MRGQGLAVRPKINGGAFGYFGGFLAVPQINEQRTASPPPPNPSPEAAFEEDLQEVQAKRAAVLVPNARRSWGGGGGVVLG